MNIFSITLCSCINISTTVLCPIITGKFCTCTKMNEKMEYIIRLLSWQEYTLIGQGITENPEVAGKKRAIPAKLSYYIECMYRVYISLYIYIKCIHGTSLKIFRRITMDIRVIASLQIYQDITFEFLGIRYGYRYTGSCILKAEYSAARMLNQ